MMPPAQTIAQAKASFKARGRPSLTEKQQRQLQRATELEQRAERLKEQEKKRVAAAAKRKAEGGQAVKEKQKVFLGTQRRRDKFGYQSSQFHLGAFLKVGGRDDKSKSTSLGASEVVEEEEEEDMFDDGDLDDETMLGALGAEPVQSTKTQETIYGSVNSIDMSSTIMPPPPRPHTLCKPPQPAQQSCADEDLSSFWDDLDSSTQVARDLDSERKKSLEDVASSLSTSFGSGSFDLTAEELDKLDPPTTGTPTAKARSIPAPAMEMPPPQLPAKRPAVPARPEVPIKRVQGVQAKQSQRQNAIRGPFLPATSLYCSPEHGFTMTQLESFVEDDLQLTQAIPG